ncbi:tRNA (5-methylaminomethyl-2-thiouridine)(34)-methyltransferase MnmD [uncultured Bacteroides sp.]|uniref:tRNA (5-methylaminomethyl-2-thiouridine)(34)-methyltransferase MnmD n=1 Tax=uncultured Bacteroides sp. TaxID=162156 RepID=UPI002AA8B801|nr:tRNA (5-methylaminomethyl-2-thiouridine)(34)-methyltransferase MnmD [uncultured Bacteroides sp.]
METKQKSLSSEIELTADGSHTLFVPSMNEHYHSVNGAKTEAEHIYINYGLKESSASPLHVLEIGFGTGLNAFLTLLETQKLHKKIIYTSLELYPLSLEKIRALNYPDVISPEFTDLYYDLHRAEWNAPCKITPDFSLLKVNIDFTCITYPDESAAWNLGTFGNEKIAYDVVYFDAFAPEKQPEMWNQKLFDAIYASMSHNGILTTYCAKGVIRRMLQSSGFTVERLPGPPGKREVLRAIKL